MRKTEKKYGKLFADLHSDLIPYYRSWCHDQPMVVSTARDEELHRVQEVLYRCARFYTEHYREYLDVVNYEEKVLDILARSERNPYCAGTFRPDYLICNDGTLRVCEITSRFFGNGYFLSYFMEHAGENFARDAGIGDYRSYFEEFLEYAAQMPGDKKKLCVLKSADKSDSIRLYVPFYRALGLETTILEAEQAEDHLDCLKDSFVVSALNQTDILRFSMDTIERMIDAQFRNDFRTVFLLHDKRFFRLFSMDRFTDRCLTKEETAFLRAHAVTTYLPEMDRDVFADARENKDRYILKHARLGKSEKVYAGCLCEEEEWRELFRPETIKDMILQPFMQQRKYPTYWKGQYLDDYVAGTILCVDDKYFGTGLFRTSTRPVINQTDAHKVAPVITDEKEKFREYHVL